MAITPVVVGASTSDLTKLPTKRFQGGHRERVRCLAWNADGRRLVSGSADKTLRVWQPEKDARTSMEMKGHLSEVSHVKWSPTHPEHFASCCANVGSSLDKGVYFWDIRQAKPTHVVETDGENINMTWSPNGKYLIVGNRRDTVKWIDVESRQVINSYKEKLETNDSLFSHNSSLLFTAQDGGIRITTFPEHQPVLNVHVSPVATAAVDLDPRGRYMAVGANDALVTLWETTEWTCVASMGFHEEPIRACQFSYDGSLLASASGGPDIQLCEVPTGRKLHTIATLGNCDAIAWHPSKKMLAYASDELDTAGRATGAFKIFGLP